MKNIYKLKYNLIEVKQKQLFTMIKFATKVFITNCSCSLITLIDSVHIKEKNYYS